MDVERWVGRGVLCADLDGDGLDEIVRWISQESSSEIRVYDADRGVPLRVYTQTTPAPLAAVVAVALARGGGPALVLCHGRRVTVIRHEAEAYVDFEALDARAPVRQAAAVDADGDGVEEVALLVGGEQEDGALRGARLDVYAWRAQELQLKPSALDVITHPGMLRTIPLWPGETARLLVWGQTFRSLDPVHVTFPVVFGAVGGGLLPVWEGPETPRGPDQCLFADLDGDGNLDMLAADPLVGGGHLLRCFNATGGRLENPMDATSPVGLLSTIAAVEFDDDRTDEIAFAESPRPGQSRLTVRKWDEGELSAVWHGDVSEQACSVAAGNIARLAPNGASGSDQAQELVCLDGDHLVLVARTDGEISITRH
ncbi:MAG: hypothetical protein ACE5R4_14375 [Armatimonadota bacterium]